MQGMNGIAAAPRCRAGAAIQRRAALLIDGAICAVIWAVLIFGALLVLP